MSIALDSAKKALKSGNYPVGAVLVINDKLIGISSNTNFDSKSFIAHAEISLLFKYSSDIKKFIEHNPDSIITLYTTLEPCLMCLGSIIINRVNRLVIANNDSHGRCLHLKSNLNKWYVDNYPQVDIGILNKESKDLLDIYKKNQLLYIQK